MADAERSLGRRGARHSPAYLTLSNMASKCSHIGHSCRESRGILSLAGIMLLTLISQPHLGQGRRVVACLVWMVGWVPGIGREISHSRDAAASLAERAAIPFQGATPCQGHQILHYTSRSICSILLNPKLGHVAERHGRVSNFGRIGCRLRRNIPTGRG